MKKLISLLLALSMLFALCACSSGAKKEEKTDEPNENVEETAETEEAEEREEAEEPEEAEEAEEIAEPEEAGKPLHIAFSSVAYSIAVLPTFLIDTFEDMCKAEGWEFDMLAAEGDPELQGEQVSTLISKKPDYLVMIPADPVMAIDWCEEAEEAGVPVICIHVDVDESCRGTSCKAYCGINNEEVAKMIYDYMAADNPDGAQIVEIAGVPVQADTITRVGTFNDCLDGESYAQLGEVYYAYSSRDDAQGGMESFIGTYGDKIDVLVGFDDDLTLGGVTALQNAGMTDVKVYSMTGQIDAMQAVKDGKLDMTVFTPTRSMCENAISAIKALEAGEALDYYQYITSIVIDADNVDEYADQAEF